MLFHVSDLGPQLVARRISNKSTAVGWTVNLAGQGVLWSNSGQVYIFLQQAPGFPPTANVLWGINESGDSCGNQDKYVGTGGLLWPKTHGFVRLATGTIQDIGPLVDEDQAARRQ